MVPSLIHFLGFPMLLPRFAGVFEVPIASKVFGLWADSPLHKIDAKRLGRSS